MTKKHLACLALMVTMLFAVCGFVFVGQAAGLDGGQAFGYGDGAVKYKTAQSDPDNSSAGKGLLLYSYDSGATADFGLQQNGTFFAKLKSVKNPYGTKDIAAYSLVFADKSSGKSFSVRIADYTGYSDACVEVGGDRAGIRYFESEWAAPAPYGMTALFNSEGNYTKFSDVNPVEVQFDPAQMTVSVKLDDGAMHCVWDLSREYNDGKQFVHDLPYFGNYTVSVRFDEIAVNGRGDLIVYSFGGYAFDAAKVNRTPSMCVNISANAVVGKTYILPKAEVTDPVDGQLSADDVTVAVYDKSGALVSDDYAFTPEKAGTYYVYYDYDKDGIKQSAFYAFEAVWQSDVKNGLDLQGELAEVSEVGVYCKTYIPAATINSTLSVKGHSVQASVRILHNGKIVDGYNGINGGFYYSFEKTGKYTVEYFTEAFGEEISFAKTVNVSDNVTVVNADDFDEVYRIGSQISVPGAEVYVGGVKTDSEFTVLYPSGKEIKDRNITLDEEGRYVVRYAFSQGGTEQFVEKTFSVNRAYADLFDGGSYGAMTSNNTVKGVKVTLTNNNTISFNKIIDLSKYSFNDKLSDKSKNKPFIRIFAQPHSQGVPDVDSFFVKLTDAHNPDNALVIRMKYVSYFGNGVFIRARSETQSTYVGYCYDFFTTECDVHSAAMHEEGGFQSYFNMSHQFNETNYEDLSLPLYFDYESRQLYSRPAWLTGHDDPAAGYTGNTGKEMPWLVYDFDTTDKVLSAGNKPWQGFTNGEVYISMYAKGISSTADFFVTEIDGKDLSEQYIFDDIAPEIDIRLPEGEIPAAKVGGNYKVFDYVVTDNLSKIVYTNVTVKHSGGKQFAIDKNNCFKPNVNGTYTITYTARDAFGNETVKSVDVEAGRNVPAIELDVDQAEINATYGQTITLPDAVYGGGSGGLNLSVTVTCGGEIMPVNYGRFVANGKGEEYTITYIVTDYVGQSAEKTVTVRAPRSDKPLFDASEVVLPPSFIHGDEYVFGKYFANYYSADYKAEQIAATITVTDGKGKTTVAADGKYIPEYNGGNPATVQFTFTSKDGKTETATMQVPVVKPLNGKGYLEKFFVTTNAGITTDSKTMVFTAENADDALGFSFVRPIHARRLTLRFVADNIGNGNIVVTLSDKYDSAGKVEFAFRKAGDSYLCSVNGGEERVVNLDGDGYLKLYYDAETRTVGDGLNVVFATLDTNTAGEPFGGFTSGYAYMSVVSTARSVGICTINNQTINNVRLDIERPYIYVDGSFEGRLPTGATITIPSADAYDVLSAIGKVTVSVVCNGKDNLLGASGADKEQTVKLTKYGSYEAVYRVEDASGQFVEQKYYFTVYDDGKPSLSFDKKLQARAALGATLTLPKYTVSDNEGADNVTVLVLVSRPDGMQDVVTDGKYTFGNAGWYTVCYFAIDRNNNCVSYMFEIQIVKEAKA